jgi:serine/threonine protein kinase
MGEPVKYNSKQKQLIHQLLEAIFSGEELNKFCTHYFPAVPDRFSVDMSNAEKIRLLIEHSAQHGQLGKLVANIEQAKPEAYQAYVQRVRETAPQSTPATKPTPPPDAGPTTVQSVPVSAAVAPPQPPQVVGVYNAEALLGRSLEDRYRLNEILDKSGLGAVFKAYDSKLELEVAVKVIDLNRVKLPALRERVQQEVRTAMKLDHPGIVQVYDFGQTDSLLYIVMEFISGYNLDETRQHLQSLDQDTILPQLIQLIQQVCLTVAYMHSQGVLHPSTIPENIMLKPGQANESPIGQPVLINLGLLRPHREALRADEAVSIDQLTYTVSPELLLSHATDIRSDVYALGVLLYDLVVGQPPFMPRNLAEAIRFHVETHPPSPRAINPTLPEMVERVILKALAKNPADRYLSVKDMAQALAGALETPRLPIPPAQPEVEASDVAISMAARPLVVTPGESTAIKLTLHQRAGQDVHCQVAVQGIPAEWVSISPSATTLSPGEQQEVTLTIQPLRSPQTRAGRHTLTIQVINKHDSMLIDEFKKVLTVAPYAQFASSLWPQEISGGQITQVTIENQGNTTETFTAQPKSDEALTFQPEWVRVKVAAGESGTAGFRVAPSGGRRWVGETITQTFSVLVSAPDGGIVTHSGEVTSQAQLTPKWVLTAILVMILCLCAVISLYFSINPTPANVEATAAKETEIVNEAIANQTAAVEIAAAQTAIAQATAAVTITGTVVWPDQADGTPTAFPDPDQLPTVTPAATQAPLTVRFSPQQNFVDVVQFSQQPRYGVGENANKAIIEVTLSAPASQQIQVDYDIETSNATEGEDYRFDSGTLVFNPGNDRKTIEIDIFDDTEDEADEIILLTLQNASPGVQIATSRAELVIVDDD